MFSIKYVARYICNFNSTMKLAHSRKCLYNEITQYEIQIP